MYISSYNALCRVYLGLGVLFDSQRSFERSSWLLSPLRERVLGDATQLLWPASTSGTCCKHIALHSKRTRPVTYGTVHTIICSYSYIATGVNWPHQLHPVQCR